MGGGLDVERMMNINRVKPYGLPSRFEKLKKPPAEIGMALIKLTVPWNKISAEYQRTKRVTSKWQVLTSEFERSIRGLPAAEKRILLAIQQHVTIEPPGSPYYGKIYPTLSEWLGTVDDFTAKDLRDLLFSPPPGEEAAPLTIENFDKRLSDFGEGELRYLRVNCTRSQTELKREFTEWVRKNVPRGDTSPDWQAFYRAVKIHYLTEHKGHSQSEVARAFKAVSIKPGSIDGVRVSRRLVRRIIEKLPLMFAPKYR